MLILQSSYKVQIIDKHPGTGFSCIGIIAIVLNVKVFYYIHLLKEMRAEVHLQRTFHN